MWRGSSDGHYEVEGLSKDVGQHGLQLKGV
jgi:hypothetical protein